MLIVPLDAVQLFDLNAAILGWLLFAVQLKKQHLRLRLFSPKSSILLRMLLLELYSKKVAITQWLRVHQKEGLYQEEKITARISGRSHLIKENEAKNYIFPYVGGGQQDGCPSVHPPQSGGSAGQNGRSILPRPTWGPAEMTRQGPGWTRRH
jgi:hypothetical protein